jgi:hypothetical protein
MTTRYFKATDGWTTVFRATATRAYQSATMHRWGISFSAKPAGLDDMATVEITKSEYEALQAAKVEQIKAHGRDPARYTSPQDSWIRNSGPRWVEGGPSRPTKQVEG